MFGGGGGFGGNRGHYMNRNDGGRDRRRRRNDFKSWTEYERDYFEGGVRLCDNNEEFYDHDDYERQLKELKLFPAMGKRARISEFEFRMNRADVQFSRMPGMNCVYRYDPQTRLPPEWNSRQDILVLGEQDFSFSKGLARALGPRKIVGTSFLLSRYTNQDDVPEYVRHSVMMLSERPYLSADIDYRDDQVPTHLRFRRYSGVDATRLEDFADAHPDMKFDCIIFPLPRGVGFTSSHANPTGSLDIQREKNRQFMYELFRSARDSRILKPGGAVYWILHETKVDTQFDWWHVRDSGEACNFKWTSSNKLDYNKLPGYIPRTETGDVFRPKGLVCYKFMQTVDQCLDMSPDYKASGHTGIYGTTLLPEFNPVAVKLKTRQATTHCRSIAMSTVRTVARIKRVAKECMKLEAKVKNDDELPPKPSTFNVRIWDHYLERLKYVIHVQEEIVKLKRVCRLLSAKISTNISRPKPPITSDLKQWQTYEKRLKAIHEMQTKIRVKDQVVTPYGRGILQKIQEKMYGLGKVTKYIVKTEYGNVSCDPKSVKKDYAFLHGLFEGEKVKCLRQVKFKSFIIQKGDLGVVLNSQPNAQGRIVISWIRLNKKGNMKPCDLESYDERESNPKKRSLEHMDPQAMYERICQLNPNAFKATYQKNGRWVESTLKRDLEALENRRRKKLKRADDRTHSFGQVKVQVTASSVI